MRFESSASTYLFGYFIRFEKNARAGEKIQVETAKVHPFCVSKCTATTFGVLCTAVGRQNIAHPQYQGVGGQNVDVASIEFLP